MDHTVLPANNTMHALRRPYKAYISVTEWLVKLIVQATIARATVTCGVSLSNAAHASQSPQSNTRPRAVAVRDVSLSQLAPRIHQFANCHRARPAAAVRYTSRVDYLTA